MKNIRIATIILLGTVALLSSCSNIAFENPQPEHANELASTTDEIRGTWLNEKGDKVKITSNKIILPDVKWRLGEDCILKASNGRYFLSTREEVGWMLMVAELEADNLHVWQFNIESSEDLNELEMLTKVTTLGDSDEETYFINPSHEEFERMLESEFLEEIGVFTRKK